MTRLRSAFAVLAAAVLAWSATAQVQSPQVPGPVSPIPVPPPRPIAPTKVLPKTTDERGEIIKLFEKAANDLNGPMDKMDLEQIRKDLNHAIAKLRSLRAIAPPFPPSAVDPIPPGWPKNVPFPKPPVVSPKTTP